MNYLIYGSSFNLIDTEIKKILGGRVPSVYYVDEIDIGTIVDDLGYDSMFEEEKIIILKNFEVLNSVKKEDNSGLLKFKDYLNNQTDSTTIIAVSSVKLGSRGALKDIVSKFKVIETPIITKPYELAKIFGEVIKKDGYGISQATLNTFTEKCNSNYDIALNEFNKLKSIKGNNKLISDEDVATIVANYNTSDMFGFKDAVINRNVFKAGAMLDDLEMSKMEVIPLVVMLAKEYTLVYNIKLMANAKMTNDAISKELNNMHPFRVKVLREASSKYTKEELENIILELSNIDLRLVSQDNTGYDELRNFLLML